MYGNHMKNKERKFLSFFDEENHMKIRARPKGLIFVPKFKRRKENQYDGKNYYFISE